MVPMCTDSCPWRGKFLDAIMACVRRFLTALLVRGEGRRVKPGMRRSISGAVILSIIVVVECLLSHQGC